MSLHGPTYLYSGFGAWNLSVELTEKLLGTVLDSRGIKKVDTFINVDKQTRLVVIAGGNAPAILSQIEETGKHVVDYVNQGGKFLGICAGAILSSNSIITKPLVVNAPADSPVTLLHSQGEIYNKESIIGNSSNFLLFPGKCIAPHVVKVAKNPSDPENFAAVEVTWSNPEPEAAKTFKMVHYSGPAFTRPPPGAKVLLNYDKAINLHKVVLNHRHVFQLTDETLVEKNPVAAFSYPCGSGKIVLSGVHPEIDPQTFPNAAEECGFPAKLPNEMKDNDEARKTFIKKVFQELKLDEKK